MKILDDGATREPSVTDEDIRAFDAARAVVRRICTDTGLTEPRVQIVDRIAGLELNGQYRVLRGAPTIYLARRAALELPREALIWLLAHELGHHKFAGAWRFMHRIFMMMLLPVLVIAAVLITRGTAALIADPYTADVGLLSVLLVMPAFLLYLAFLAKKRADETRADSFAVLYQGHLRGAEQCLELWETRKPQQLPPCSVYRRINLLMQSHPYRYMRLASMAAVLRVAQPPLS